MLHAFAFLVFVVIACDALLHGSESGGFHGPRSENPYADVCGRMNMEQQVRECPSDSCYMVHTQPVTCSGKSGLVLLAYWMVI